MKARESVSGHQERRGSRSAWRVATSRNFGPYFVGNAVSASGTWFYNLAGSVLVFELTHSVVLLGVFNFSQFLPVLVLAPWAGRLSDSYDRRTILLVTQPLAAAISAGLAVTAWAGHASVAVVLAFSVCLGCVMAFSNTAQMAIVGTLVERSELAQAISLNAITFNVARAIGPTSAAGVIALFGTATAFAVNALSFLVFTVGLLVVTTRPRPRSGATRLRESFAVLRAQPRLIGMLAVIVTVGIVADPINTEGPAFAHEFGLSPVWAGAIVGAFGVGAVLGGIFLGGREASPIQIAGTLVVMGAGVVGLAVAPWFALALVFVGVAGAGYLSSNAAATAQLQLGVDESLWGRIMALWTIAFLGVRPFASMFDGALSGAIGVHAAAVVMSLPAFGLALAIAIGHRSGLPWAAAPLRSPDVEPDD